MNQPSFSTPVYLVLGATGGIGSETARRLRDAGATVRLAARDESRLQQLASELDCEWAQVDATSSDEVLDWVQSCRASGGRIDGIVSCVGSLLLKPVHRVTPEEWREVVDTNLGSAFSVVRAASQVMRRGGGSVVLLSTAAASIGLMNHEAISAAKAGVEGLALAAAASHATRGLRFNVVAPGMVKTGLTEKLLATPASEKASVAMHALGRIGQPEDVASAIVWLLAPEQGWVSGQVLGVDGGLARLKPSRAER